uniref:WD_REPEATS_REGION domain-containing protein n=1 Tax=Trichuris muris TaxID=70415 RepID=A0A5S6QA20_TRIMR
MDDELSVEQLLSKSRAHECPTLSTIWICGHGSDVIVTGDLDGNLLVWKWLDSERRLELSGELPTHSLGVASLNITPDRRYFVSFSLDCEIRIYDVLDNMECLNSSFKVPLECWGVSISPDGKNVACGSKNGKVVLYAVDMENPISTYESGGRFVLSSAFSIDGHSLAAGTQDGLIYIFDVESGAMQHSLTGHAKAVRTMEFSQDGALLFSGAEDKFLVTHDLREGSKTSFSVSGQNSWITSVTAMPDARYVITSSTDALVRVWDFRNRKCSSRLTGRRSSVWDVCLNIAGDRLVSVDDDGRIMIHDTTNLCKPAPISASITDVIDSTVHQVS